LSAIPLVDLRAQYEAHRSEIDAALSHAIGGAHFIGGPDHEAFARDFGAFCGGLEVALCGNGTDALCLALLETLGNGDGSGEVVTVSHTFAATAEAIVSAGYLPVFVDVDEKACLMDVEKVEAVIGPRTRAIVPVHLYGQMVPMDALSAVAARHGLPVIEDAAQAHGATWRGRGPGAYSDAACFSFFPSKNLGAWGDGGAVVTRKAALAARIRARANHGRTSKYEHGVLGVNSRLDGIQASVLRVKLRHLARANERRREVASWYVELLADIPAVRLPLARATAEHVYHLFVVQVKNRDGVLARLREDGVEAGVHYPIPVHEQPAFQGLGIPPDALPITHRLARDVLSLPLYPEISRAQVESVAAALRKAI